MKKKYQDGSTLTKETVFCSCGSDEHQLIFSYYDDDPKTVYCSVFLSNYKNFFKRFIYAIKYTFGYKSKYGAFDSIIIEEENIDIFKKIVNNFEILN